MLDLGAFSDSYLDCQLISKLFSAIGDEIYMEDERFLDMATAISG